MKNKSVDLTQGSITRAMLLFALPLLGTSIIQHQLLGGFANILGNTLFIYIFHFGVAGAAMATFLSQTVAAVLTIRRLCHLQEEYRLCLREIRIEPHTLKQIFLIGVPVGVQTTALCVSIYYFSGKWKRDWIKSASPRTA